MSDCFPGNCSCGRIRFEVTAARANVVNCHCSQCRKLNGSPFSTYFVISEKNFNVSEGAEYLSSYAPSDNAVKHFCKVCGTPIFNQNLRYPRLRMVHLGTLNPPEEIKPDVNIFCQSKLSWVSFNCEITSFEKEIEE